MIESIGIRQWYNDPSNAPSAQARTGATWPDILAVWDVIDIDFDERGHDLFALLDSRPWRWFTKRLVRVTADPRSLTYAALHGKDDDGAST